MEAMKITGTGFSMMHVVTSSHLPTWSMGSSLNKQDPPWLLVHTLVSLSQSWLVLRGLFAGLVVSALASWCGRDVPGNVGLVAAASPKGQLACCQLQAESELLYRTDIFNVEGSIGGQLAR